MRGVGVNPVGVRRVTVFFFVIERTFPEAAEQTPPAQERGPRRRPESRTITHALCGRTPITDESWRLRVRGADGSRATSIRAGGDAPDTRDLFVKPGSERPFYTTVHR